MSLLGVVAIYFIVWWVSLFAVLPWGVRSQAESAQAESVPVAPGTDPGAPVRPQLVKKAIATSFVAAIVTGLIVFIMMSGVIRLEDLPMPFDVRPD